MGPCWRSWDWSAYRAFGRWMKMLPSSSAGNTSQATIQQQRQGLLARLAHYEGEIDPVLQSLGKRTYRPVEPGYHGEKHVASADLRKKHPDCCSTLSCRKITGRTGPPGSSYSCTAAGPPPRRGLRKRPCGFPMATPRRYSSRSGDMLAATGAVRFPLETWRIWRAESQRPGE